MFDELNKVYDSMNAGYDVSRFNSFESIAYTIANVMVFVAFSTSFVMLAYTGVQFLMTQGDPKFMDKARHAAGWTVIAFLVSMLAWGIKNIALRLLGVEPGGESV